MTQPIPIDEQVRGIQVLTSKGGGLEVSDSLRAKVAYLEDGRLFVSAADIRSAEVESFITRQKVRGKAPSEIIPVPLSDIARIYALTADAGIAGLGNNVQATRIRELVTAAASQRATDIHWLLFEDTGVAQVLFRVNGLLEHHKEWEHNFALELLRSAYQQRENATQLTPTINQDARISDPALMPRGISSIRVVSGPNARGLEQVWRLTYADVVAHGSLLELGYGKQQTELISSAARSPYGMIVIGGPTGSGKSTTLQTVLAGIYRASQGKRNIYTIEEPVEMPIPGARQHSTGVTTEAETERNAAYIAETRRMLRSDPDVVMFGEIRDNETAGVAVRTALAGRLVFTTLHGNTVLDLMLRVIHDLKVGKVLATDHGVFLMYISQSLVPALCKRCCVPAKDALSRGHHQHTEDEIRRILSGFTDLDSVRFVGVGCEHCRRTGYGGRVLVAEVMRTTPEIMEAMRNDDKAEAMRLWLRRGGVTKRRVAHIKAAKGLVDPLTAEFHVGDLSALDCDGSMRNIDDVLNYGYRAKETT